MKPQRSGRKVDNEAVKEFERQFARKLEALRQERRPAMYKAAQLLQHIFGEEAPGVAERQLAEAEGRFRAALHAKPLDEEAAGDATREIWIWRDVVLILRTLDTSLLGQGRA